MPRRYRDFPKIPGGAALRRSAVEEIGGTPETNPVGWALRSPIAHARRIARSGVPLQIWWSDRDQIVIDQEHQSQALYERVMAINPEAPVKPVFGHWRHSAEYRADRLLPRALEDFGLLAV